MQPIRLLTFTTLYPNAAQPEHGVFVENRLRHVVASGEALATVLAPVPFLPPLARRFPRWARFAAVPPREERAGLRILHPRYPHLPAIGMGASPFLLYARSAAALRRLLAAGERFDAIDAHYLYPDGVAAIWLGRSFGLPVVLTARGSDVSLLPSYAMPRRLIRAALGAADGLIAVSTSLTRAMEALGAPNGKTRVLRNGVDTAMFRPLDRNEVRHRLSLTRPTLVSVGLLIDRKGHHRTIEAMRALPDMELLIAGEGPERGRLEALIDRLGLRDRVRLLGAQPHDQLAALYSAADATVLASSREGWANVLLESMACGTPVVASNIWGNPEVVAEPAAGRIYDPNTPQAIADAVRDLFRSPRDRAATRAYAERFGWEPTTQGQLDLFRQVISGRLDRTIRLPDLPSGAVAREARVSGPQTTSPERAGS